MGRSSPTSSRIAFSNFQLQRHPEIGNLLVQARHGLYALLAVSQLDVVEAVQINGQLLVVLRLEGRLAPHVLDLVDGQPVVIGYLLVDSVWVPPVQNQLLDDLVLSVCKLNRHGTQVPDGRGYLYRKFTVCD